ncbi:MAG TPA: hypothetical protein VFS23_31655 [Vicinamibacterales bacterium]|nr:hypothetical protein [Vicinamibacterales bacterium]
MGLVFAKKPPALRYVMNNGPAAINLAIPPKDGNAEIVSEMTTNVDMKLIGVLVDPKIDPARLFSPSGPSLLPRGASGPTLSALN